MTNNGTYHFRLYVAGRSARAVQSEQSLKELLENKLKAKYIFEIIDVLKHPDMAVADDILATPTLVKTHPAPIRKIIGDMCNTEMMLSHILIFFS
jgi:circadian clock protein KaiB